MQGGQSAAVCGVGGPHGKLICTVCQDREILLTLLRVIREGRVAIAVGRNDRPWCRVHKRSQGSIIPVVASARGCNYCARSARWPTSVAACTMGGTRGPLGGLLPRPSPAARPGLLSLPALAASLRPPPTPILAVYMPTLFLLLHVGPCQARREKALLRTLLILSKSFRARASA